jgi:hypothetical protein
MHKRTAKNTGRGDSMTEDEIARRFGFKVKIGA